MSEETNPQDDYTPWQLMGQINENLASILRQNEADKGKHLDPVKVLRRVQQEIQKSLSSTEQAIIDYSARDLLQDYWNQATRRTNTATTGFKSLNDALSGGIESERLVIALGAPNTGKTTLVHQIADHIADSGRPVLYVTSEDSPSALIAKTLARVGGIDYTPVLKGWSDYERVIKVTIEKQLERMSSERLRYLDATSGVDMGIIKDRARAHFERYSDSGPGVLVVDYLQRIARAVKTKNNLTADLREVVTRVAEELRGIAQDLHCGVIAIASQNRGGYTRGDSGSMASAKESGDIEYTADVMFALVEDKDRKKTVPHLTPVALYIDKNRQGKKDIKIALDFYSDRQQFTEAARND
jgi:replicative DNA helicase